MQSMAQTIRRMLVATPRVSSPGIRRIPGDFEAKIALLTCLSNGISPRHRQQAIEARG